MTVCLPETSTGVADVNTELIADFDTYIEATSNLLLDQCQIVDMYNSSRKDTYSHVYMFCLCEILKQ